MSESLWYTVVEAIFSATGRSLRKCLPNERFRKAFALDVAAVALGIRTGYLVDAFGITSTGPFRAFVSQLREHDSIIFKDLLYVHDADSLNHFLLNSALLRARFSDWGSPEPGTMRPLFIELHTPPRVISTPQVLVELRHFIRQIDSGEFIFDRLSEKSLDQCSLVPLAACFLEYPAAYVPISPTQQDFLHHTPLEVYEYILSAPLGRSQMEFRGLGLGIERHSLLKFSCPVGIFDQIPAGREIVEALRLCLAKRLREAECEAAVAIEVNKETLDRVAL